MQRVKDIVIETTNGCRYRYMNASIKEHHQYLELFDFKANKDKHFRMCFPWTNIVGFSFTVDDSEVET